MIRWTAMAMLVGWTGSGYSQIDLDDINPLGVEPFTGTEEPAPPPEATDAAAPTVESVYADAEAAMEAGEYDKAIASLNMILAGNPSYAPAAFLRGRAFREIGEKQLALNSFRTAVDYGARFGGNLYPTALKERGQVLMELGSVEEALQDFIGAVEAAPSDPEALYLRGKAYIRVATNPSSAYGGESAQYMSLAIASLTRAITIQPDVADSFSERGNAYSMSNRYNEAIEDYRKAIELAPDDANLQAEYGFTVLRRAEYSRKRPEADPDQIRADYQSAIDAFTAYLATEGDKPLSAFENALPDEYRPSQVALARSSARVLLANELGGGEANQQLYQDAIADAEQAYAFDPNGTNALYQKAVAQRMLGHLEDATATLTDLLEISPGFSEANLRRGICYYYLGDYEAARRDFEQAIMFSQNRDGRAEFWIGVALAKEGDYDGAVRFYSQAIHINPRNKLAYSNRGLALMHLKQFRRASGDFEELLRRDRNDTISRERRDHAVKMMRD